MQFSALLNNGERIAPKLPLFHSDLNKRKHHVKIKSTKTNNNHTLFVIIPLLLCRAEVKTYCFNKSASQNLKL